MLQSQPIAPATYRIAPELRRCCWYTIVGAILMMPVALWVFKVARPNDQPLPAALMLLCMALAAAVPLHCRLCVDQDGITRRRLFWGPVWHWSDFSSGRILKQQSQLIDPSRPFGNRKLELGHLSRSDRRDIVDLVNQFYRLPPPPQLPEKLEVRRGLSIFLFDATGIQVFRRKQNAREYSWDDVRRVQFIRIDPLRRDFQCLLIELPREEIELRRHDGNTTWRGATDEQISEFVIGHARPSAIRSFISGEDSDDPDHLEYLLRGERQRLRNVLGCLRVFGPLIVACLVWMAIDDGRPIRALLMAGLMAVIYLPLFSILIAQQRRRIRALESHLAALKALC